MAPESLVVGVLYAPGVSRDLMDELAAQLPDELQARFANAGWRTEISETDPAEPLAESDALVDAVRRQMLERDWNIAVGVTELPLTVDRRPVDACAARTHVVGLVSLPALGPLRLRQHLTRTVASLVETLVGRRAGRTDDAWRRGISVAAKLRLVAGMVRVNQPARLIARLSRAVVGALGTGSFALASANVWMLSDSMSWPRLLAVTAFAAVLMCAALVIAHDLWERAEAPAARERVTLFNVATLLTLAIGVLACFAVLFAISAGAAAVLIPPDLFANTVHHPVDAAAYVRLAWVVGTIATVGGALGSLVESDAAVRAAAYRRRIDPARDSDAAEHGSER